jgi:hypothetical protein
LVLTELFFGPTFRPHKYETPNAQQLTSSPHHFRRQPPTFLLFSSYTVGQVCTRQLFSSKNIKNRARGAWTAEMLLLFSIWCFYFWLLLSSCCISLIFINKSIIFWRMSLQILFLILLKSAHIMLVILHYWNVLYVLYSSISSHIHKYHIE